MILPRWILVFFMIFVLLPDAWGHTENYPPHSFKDGPPKHLTGIIPLVVREELYRTNGNFEFRSPDGVLFVKAGWRVTAGNSEEFLFIREGGFVLVDEISDVAVMAVYYVDIDGNRLKDFLVFKSYMGCGSGGWRNRVEIYLKEKDGLYHRIAYDTENADLKDFVALKKKGCYGVLIEDQVDWENEAPQKLRLCHTCFSYDFYEFRKFKLVNANAAHKGFPKFVWWKFKKNDQDNLLMKKEQRKIETRKKDESISFQIIDKAWKGELLFK